MQEMKSWREKRRKRSHRDPEERGGKRRSVESSTEGSSEGPDGAARADPSDVEEGGLDLSVTFEPIGAYLSDRKEMLEQCFRVLGQKKLMKMLPEQLKGSSLEEIKTSCWDQLQQLSEAKLLQILEGVEVTADSEDEEKDAEGPSAATQQDNSVDSTSSVRGGVEAEEKPGSSSEESDVLSINADMDDSDIEGPKPPRASAPPPPAPPPSRPAPEPKPDRLQRDIDRSVNEILSPATPGAGHGPEVGPVAVETTPAPPSVQQLALLELEMRARAIKALMKAGQVKK